MAGKRKAFAAGDAREAILARCRRAGAKGATSPVTAKTAGPKRALLEAALDALEAERAIVADRGRARPRYYLAAHAPPPPSCERLAEKIEHLAASRHPVLLTATALKKAAAGDELPLFAEVLRALEASRRLVRLGSGKSHLYAHAGSLRAMLDGERAPVRLPAAGTIREAYRRLVARGGFPDVGIAVLAREAEASIDALKDWLLAENRAGRAVFGMGDWSLSDEATRAGAIELRGDRYLKVRLEP